MYHFLLLKDRNEFNNGTSTLQCYLGSIVTEDFVVKQISYFRFDICLSTLIQTFIPNKNKLQCLNIIDVSYNKFLHSCDDLLYISLRYALTNKYRQKIHSLKINIRRSHAGECNVVPWKLYRWDKNLKYLIKSLIYITNF